VERINNNLRINVIFHGPENHLTTVRVSPRKTVPDVTRTVNLLLVCVQRRKSKGCVIRHYLPVVDLGRLIPQNDGHRRHTCVNCHSSFTTEAALDNHERCCLHHGPATIEMPAEGETMQFTRHNAKIATPIVGFADFEACMEKPDVRCSLCKDSPLLRDKCEHRTIKMQEQKPMMYVLLFFDKCKKKVFEASGWGTPEETMTKFYADLRQAEIELSNLLLREKKPMNPLSNERENGHRAARVCYLCERPFGKGKSLSKVHDHDHYTGEYIGPAHNLCNMLRTSSVSKFPIFMHNLTSYDSHFIISHLEREHLKEEKFLSAIPINGEKFKTISLGKFRFVDSLNFLPSSLFSLTENLRLSQSCDFEYVRQTFPNALADDRDERRLSLLLRKGVCPYEWIRSAEFLHSQTSFPPLSAFHSTLTNSDISQEDYEHGCTIYEEFKCRNMLDYVYLYCRLDVALLAECVFSFRDEVLRQYQLDMCQYITLPQLAFDAMLLMTGSNVGLIYDIDQLLFIEEGIRGGVSFVNERHATGSADPEDCNGEHILYIDANNLYGLAQSAFLPYGNYRFLEEKDFLSIDWSVQDEEQETGYVIECDLEYPEELYRLHQSLPVAPDNVEIHGDMLSDFSRDALRANTGKDGSNYKSHKLLGWFGTRKKYVTHYLNLKLYLRLGLKLKAVHRVLAFDQAPFIKPYVQKTAELRAAALSDFAKTVHKLFANACYGKTLQNNRKHGHVGFYTSAEHASRVISLPTMENFKIINANVVAIFQKPTRVKMDRCYAVGFSILELSKRFVFSEYYFRIAPVLGPSCRVLMSDTDSLMLYFFGQSKNEALKKLQHVIDFSNYPKDHPLFDESKKNEIRLLERRNGRCEHHNRICRN